MAADDFAAETARAIETETLLFLLLLLLWYSKTCLHFFIGDMWQRKLSLKEQALSLRLPGYAVNMYKCCTVDNARAVFTNGRHVRFGAIPFMYIESI